MAVPIKEVRHSALPYITLLKICLCRLQAAAAAVSYLHAEVSGSFEQHVLDVTP
jgi:hypothetical protein